MKNFVGIFRQSLVAVYFMTAEKDELLEHRTTVLKQDETTNDLSFHPY